MIYLCEYCDLIFESKRKLYDHFSVHSKSEREQEINSRKKN